MVEDGPLEDGNEDGNEEGDAEAMRGPHDAGDRGPLVVTGPRRHVGGRRGLEQEDTVEATGGSR